MDRNTLEMITELYEQHVRQKDHDEAVRAAGEAINKAIREQLATWVMSHRRAPELIKEVAGYAAGEIDSGRIDESIGVDIIIGLAFWHVLKRDNWRVSIRNTDPTNYSAMAKKRHARKTQEERTQWAYDMAKHRKAKREARKAK